MKRLLFSLLLLSLLTAPIHAAEKNTALIHPGETVYIRFEMSGKKIRFQNASTTANDAAQVILTFGKELKGGMRQLKVENKFPETLVYRVEMRSLKANHQMRTHPSPVVGGKVAFDDYPPIADEVACFDFKLER